MREITTAQLKGLRTVYDMSIAHGRAPTVRELMTRLGFTSTNAIVELLSGLTRKGFIERPAAGNTARRPFVFTEKGRAALGLLLRGPYTLEEWDACEDPDIDRIRETIIALAAKNRRAA